MEIVYNPGKVNNVADALSRKAELAAIQIDQHRFVSTVQPSLLDRIKAGLSKDTQAISLLALAKEGKTRRFWVDDNILWTIGSRLYVPDTDGIRKELIKECHDTLWAGHPGWHRTMALLERGYFWPKVREDVMGYIRTCLIC